MEQDEQPLDESADRMDADVDADTAANATTPAEPQQVPQATPSQVSCSVCRVEPTGLTSFQAAEGPEQPSGQGAHVTDQTAGPSAVGAPPMPHATLSQGKMRSDPFLLWRNLTLSKCKMRDSKTS